MSYLKHYNHNHDALGRFARSNGMVSGNKRSITKAAYKEREILDRFHESTDKESYPYKKGEKILQEYASKNMTNRQRVIDKTNNELLKSKKIRELKKQTDDAYKKMMKKYNRFEFDSEYEKLEEAFYDADNKYSEAREQVIDKYVGDFADAYLEDLNIKNTKKSRDFVIKYADSYWYSEEDPDNPQEKVWNTYASVDNKTLSPKAPYSKKFINDRYKRRKKASNKSK